MFASCLKSTSASTHDSDAFAFSDYGVQLSFFLNFARPHAAKTIHEFVRSVLRPLGVARAVVERWAAAPATRDRVRSHADALITYVSTYKVQDLIDALESTEYEEEGETSPERFVWFDFLSLPLAASAAARFRAHDRVWSHATRVEVVLVPYQDVASKKKLASPSTLRLWSIYEYSQLVSRKIPYVVRVSRETSARLEAEISSVIPRLEGLRIHLKRAKSYDPQDRKLILASMHAPTILFIEASARQLVVGFFKSVCARVALRNEGADSMRAYKVWADIEMQDENLRAVVDVTEQALLFARRAYGEIAEETLGWTRSAALAHHFHAEDENRSNELFVQSAAIIKELYAHDLSSAKVGRLMESAARFVLLNEAPDIAQRLYASALFYVRDEPPRDDILSMHNGLALCYYKTLQYDEALEHLLIQSRMIDVLYGAKSKAAKECGVLIRQVREKGLHVELRSALLSIMNEFAPEQPPRQPRSSHETSSIWSEPNNSNFSS